MPPSSSSHAGSTATLSGRALRVLSVPAGHVYVRHLDAPVVGGVVRLPDPSAGHGVPASQWWPPPALDAVWVEQHADEFDVFHLHFGFEGRTTGQLVDLVRSLRRAGKPLVLTVHDLRNPHLSAREQHDEHLDVLVPAADALVTLTPGAAAEVERRWGRRPEVLGHPHVVEEPDLSAARTRHDGFVVGLHLKSLRAGMAAGPVLDTLTRVVATLPGARLRVDIHSEVMAAGGPRHDADLTARLRAGHERGLLDLHVHDYFTDEGLWGYLRSLDLSVLPYRFGTHSGWLEACHDLGTPVLAPDCGYFAEQRPCYSFHLDEDGLDEQDLARGVHRVHAERPAWRADPADRRAERVHLARAHRRIYLDALEALRG